MPTTDLPAVHLSDHLLRGLLRYAAGHAISCQVCGAILDWKTVQQVEGEANDAQGETVDRCTVVVCGAHDAADLLAEIPQVMLEGRPKAQTAEVRVTSKAHGLDHVIASATRSH